MNEIVKPNTAMANAETLFDLKSKVETMSSDVEALVELVEDALSSDAVDVSEVPTKVEPVSKVETFELGSRDVKRLAEWVDTWMTLEMLQYFLGAKGRNSASAFLQRVKASGQYEVEVVKLPYGRQRMYKIVAKVAA